MGRSPILQGKSVWPYSPHKPDLNHMNFFGDGEGDDVDAIKDTKAKCKAAISDAQVKSMIVVHDLFRHVWAKLPEADKKAEICRIGGVVPIVSRAAQTQRVFGSDRPGNHIHCLTCQSEDASWLT